METRKRTCPRHEGVRGHLENNRRHYSTLDEFAYEYGPRREIYRLVVALGAVLLAAMVLGQVMA